MPGVLSPICIVQQAFCKWWKNLFAVVAIYSLTLLLMHTLRFYSMVSRQFYRCAGEWFAAAFSTAMYAAVFFLNSFIVLIVIHYFFAKTERRLSFEEAFNGAREKALNYFKSLLLYNGLVFILIGFSVFFFVVGKKYFGPEAAAGMNMPVLLTTSTATVILLIAAAWYGFFFSLAPLISAFEQKGAWASLGLSKSRIRYCPWRYLAVFLIFFCLYFLVGIALYALIAVLSVHKSVLGWIDPVMMAVWMPLLLAAWVLNYEKLTQMK